jgi:hypothetical protein
MGANFGSTPAASSDAFTAFGDEMSIEPYRPSPIGGGDESREDAGHVADSLLDHVPLDDGGEAVAVPPLLLSSEAQSLPLPNRPPSSRPQSDERRLFF